MFKFVYMKRTYKTSDGRVYNEGEFYHIDDVYVAEMTDSYCTVITTESTKGLIQNNVLRLEGASLADIQTAIESIEAGTAGVQIPTADNDVWLLVEANTASGSVTITNRYLSVEVVSGAKTITVVKGY